jgi:hypothetical protein
MPERPHYEPVPEHHDLKALEQLRTKVSDLYISAQHIPSANREHFLRLCVAQQALLEQDLGMHADAENAAGDTYSAEEETIATLNGIISDLQRKRSGNVSASIADLDPDRN